MFDGWPSGGVSWRGIGILKQPTDLWLQHQIIWHTRPDVVVETGTWRGGSAIWYAELDVEVHTVDVRDQTSVRHPRVTYHLGEASNPEVAGRIREACEGRKVMVVLDSDHHKNTVSAELEAYAPLVSSGCYLIVEDTTLFPGEGPAEALADWLPNHPEFTVDRSVTVTEHPGGYLVRS